MTQDVENRSACEDAGPKRHEAEYDRYRDDVADHRREEFASSPAVSIFAHPHDAPERGYRLPGPAT
jgi:hypothetical protein